ncbi:MAG: hypothetical protein E6G39_04075 [Actinobacteria bacterium]|nr:MAG: hypothetical protein E6G39_04075 [Actinomycetota bacterium]
MPRAVRRGRPFRTVRHRGTTAPARVHLAHIRRKLEPDATRPRYFITEPGVGYRFEPDATLTADGDP